jgi:hypothetical protein
MARVFLNFVFIFDILLPYYMMKKVGLQRKKGKCAIPYWILEIYYFISVADYFSIVKEHKKI